MSNPKHASNQRASALTSRVWSSFLALSCSSWWKLSRLRSTVTNRHRLSPFIFNASGLGELHDLSLLLPDVRLGLVQRILRLGLS